MSYLEEAPGADRGHAGEIISVGWLGNTLVSPLGSWRMWPGSFSASLAPVTWTWISDIKWFDGWIAVSLCTLALDFN